MQFAISPTNQTTSFETQMIPMTPQVLRRTLNAHRTAITNLRPDAMGRNLIAPSGPQREGFALAG